METINERIYRLRKHLGLSQEAFGQRIGIKKASISMIEKGKNNPSEQTIKSICREFDVNYAWIMEGLGEMFSDLDKKIVKSYMQLTEEKRKVIKEYLHDIFISE